MSLAGVKEREGGMGGADAAGDRGALARVARRPEPPRRRRTGERGHGATACRDNEAFFEAMGDIHDASADDDE